MRKAIVLDILILFGVLAATVLVAELLLFLKVED